MGRQVVADIDGITLTLNDLIQQFGLITAAVFGRIWAYCQLPDGVCKASLVTIAAELQLDRATVYRSARKLVDEGYLEDTTPKLRKHPHIYKDTGKAGLNISITARTGVAHSNTSPESGSNGVAHSNTTKTAESAGVAHSNTRKGQKGPGVAHSNTKGSGVAQDVLKHVVVVKHTLNINSEEQQHVSLQKELAACGISPEVAADLVSQHKPERILLACDVYRFQRHRKKARSQGYLVDFLEGSWEPPADYIPAERRCPDCWQDVDDHAEGCPGYKVASKYTGSIICPVCSCYPCDCDNEPVEEVEEPQTA
jgi:DNA-binding Lrp family transcriptional regulator